MKRNTLVAAIACLAVGIGSLSSAYSQGSIYFANYTFDTYAPVTISPGGARIGGPDWHADLLYRLGSEPDFTLAAGSLTTFLGSYVGDDANGAGLFMGPVVVIPDYQSGPIEFVVRAFYGNDFSMSLLRGVSAPFTLPSISTGVNPVSEFGPALKPFSIIPEPSTSFLLAPALCVLLLRRCWTGSKPACRSGMNGGD